MIITKSTLQNKGKVILLESSHNPLQYGELVHTLCTSLFETVQSAESLAKSHKVNALAMHGSQRVYVKEPVGENRADKWVVEDDYPVYTVRATREIAFEMFQYEKSDLLSEGYPQTNPIIPMSEYVTYRYTVIGKPDYERWASFGIHPDTIEIIA